MRGSERSRLRLRLGFGSRGTRPKQGWSQQLEFYVRSCLEVDGLAPYRCREKCDVLDGVNRSLIQTPAKRLNHAKDLSMPIRMKDDLHTYLSLYLV